MKMVGGYDDWSFVISDGGISFWRRDDLESAEHKALPGIALMEWLNTDVYKQGQRDALDAAVQRVEGYLQHDVADGWMPRRKAEGIIAVLKGDQQ